MKAQGVASAFDTPECLDMLSQSLTKELGHDLHDTQARRALCSRLPRSSEVSMDRDLAQQRANHCVEDVRVLSMLEIKLGFGGSRVRDT